MKKKPYFYSFETDGFGDTVTVSYDGNRKVIARTITYTEELGHKMMKSLNEDAQHINHRGAVTAVES